MSPARRRVPFVGLTGGIGAGKSEALAALDRLGAETLSSDAVVHDLLGNDPEVRARLLERFGDAVAPDGAVDRSKVAEVVFADPDERGWLEQLLWPRVGARIADWREELAARADPPAAGVVEVPLLFEAGMEDAFDATVAIVADEAVRERRAAERGHAGLASRTSRQLGQDEKAARADFVVRNDGDLEALEASMSDVLAKLGP